MRASPGRRTRRTRTPAALTGGERPAAAQLGVVEAVDVVRSPDQEIQVEGPVLPGLEGSKTIEHEGLADDASRSELLVQQQTVTAESLRLALQCAGSHAEFAGNLAQARAGEQAREQRAQQVGALEPVAGREGL